jgi:hypothetical protein
MFRNKNKNQGAAAFLILKSEQNTRVKQCGLKSHFQLLKNKQDK